MFLRAGAVSLALLLASRLLGLLRESAQAAAFGSSGLGDLAVLMLSLPDWLAGVLASGALAYVLVPHWADRSAAAVAASQRGVAMWLLAGGVALGLALAALRHPAVAALAGGLGPALRPGAAQGLLWCALAVPLALLAALWVTRLQHEQDFTGMYGANLVVNGVLVGTLAALGASGQAGVEQTIGALGLGLLAAMALRLAWLAWRLHRPAPRTSQADARTAADGPRPWPAPPLWLWAMLSAGLPLALPFAARSLASSGGEGALAVFGFAWKLVELPLMLAIQLVATLALPRIAQALARSDPDEADSAIQAAFALAFALACAAVAGLQWGGPALAALMFGWGRMDAIALQSIAAWGAAGAWGLLPQALAAVALAVLASRARLAPAALAYALALAALLVAGASGLADGAALMWLLNGLYAAVALLLLAAMGRAGLRSLPWRALAWPLAALLLVATPPAAGLLHPGAWGMAAGLAAGALAAVLTLAVAWAGAPALRLALRR